MNTKLRLNLLLMCLFAGLLAATACSRQETQSPQALRFRQEIESQLALLAPELAKALARDDDEAAAKAIAGFMAQTSWAKLPCGFSVHCVDETSRYVTGQRFTPGKGSATVEKVRVSYSHFQDIFEELKRGEITPTRFYDSEGPYLVICAPLFKDDKYVGAAGFILPDQCLPDHFGLSTEQILDIDFN